MESGLLVMGLSSCSNFDLPPSVGPMPSSGEKSFIPHSVQTVTNALVIIKAQLTNKLEYTETIEIHSTVHVCVRISKISFFNALVAGNFPSQKPSNRHSFQIAALYSTVSVWAKFSCYTVDVDSSIFIYRLVSFWNPQHKRL